MTAALVISRAHSGPERLQSYDSPRIQEEFEKALFAGEFQKAEKWLGQGAEINRDGNPILCTVASLKIEPSRKLAIVNFLFEHGAVKNGAMARVADQDGRTPLHHAARLGEFRFFNLYVSKHPEFDAADRWGYTALHELAESRSDHTAIPIKAWVDAGGPLDLPNNKFETPLCISCKLCHFPQARALFDSGAAVGTVTEGGETPFSFALRIGVPEEYPSPYGQPHLREFNYLSLDMLERIGPDDPVSKERTPLVFIAQVKRINDQGHPINMTQHIRRLLERQASLDARDLGGNTPLHIASMRGDEQFAALLLGANGINLELVNDKGQTPIQAAAERDRGNIVELLYARGAQVPEAARPLLDQGRTAEAIAIIRGEA